MKEEDLINKLENLETPDIDLPGHRQALRAALINSDRFHRRTAMGWARILAPVAAAVALIVVFGFFNIIQPRMQIAQATEIAMGDARVRALMTEYGLQISEVQLQDGEAFLLLSPRLIRGHPDEIATEDKTASAPPSDDGTRAMMDRLLEWVLPSSAYDDSTRVTPYAGLLPPGEEGTLPCYLVKIDLTEKNVSGVGELERVAPIGEIDIDAIEFLGPESTGAEAPGETDQDQGGPACSP